VRQFPSPRTQEGERSKTSQVGLDKKRLQPKVHTGKRKQKGKVVVLPGLYYMYTISIPTPSRKSKLPFVVMHMPKPPTRVSLVAVEPATALDAAAATPVGDAPPPGTLSAASEITPEDPLEEVTGLVEHLSLTKALPDAPSPGEALPYFFLPGDFYDVALTAAAVSRPS